MAVAKATNSFPLLLAGPLQLLTNTLLKNPILENPLLANLLKSRDGERNRVILRLLVPFSTPRSGYLKRFCSGGGERNNVILLCG
jgi:hypothetical protein